MDRRVSLDVVGNVLHGLCGLLEWSGEKVLERYDATRRPHQVRSGRPPWVSASERHTPARERVNLWGGILRKG